MTEYWNREKPLDLRVKSSTKRENKPYDRENANKKNCILASLLKQPSSSQSNIEHLNSSQRIFRNNPSITCENNNVSNFIVSRTPETAESSFSKHHLSSVSIHQSIINSYQHKIDFKTNCIKQEIDSDEITVIFDSYRDLANGLNKNCNNQPTSESAKSGFVPNYRKFYARCHSNQAFNPKSNNKQITDIQTFNQSELTFSNFPERRNELDQLNSIHYQNRFQDTHLQQQKVSSIKIEPYIETCRSDCSSENFRYDKDKILKCLLTNTVNDKIYFHNNYTVQNPMYDKKLQFSKDVFLRLRYPQLNLKQQQSCHIYYPEAVRAVQKNSILKSLLVTNHSKSDPALRSSGSYDAGSPGSESTTSGSTDSGVFSDILPDERRRISRSSSNRYIKTGTGASVETLKILRQVIMERRQRTHREI